MFSLYCEFWSCLREYKKICAVKIQEIISWKREGDTTATKYKVIKVAFVPTGGFRPFRDEIHVILITRIQPTTPWIGTNTEWFCAVKIKIYFTYAFLKNAGAPGYSLHFFLCSIFMLYFLSPLFQRQGVKVMPVNPFLSCCNPCRIFCALCVKTSQALRPGSAKAADSYICTAQA